MAVVGGDVQFIVKFSAMSLLSYAHPSVASVAVTSVTLRSLGALLGMSMQQTAQE